MDTLSDLLNRVTFNTDVFFTGHLCGIQALGGSGTGHLHLLQSGTLTVLTNEGHKIVMDEPSVILIPGQSQHRILSSESENAQLVCASIDFDSANKTQFIESLPQFIYFKLASQDTIAQAAQWLFDEAFANRKGKQVMLDKLSDVFFIQVLRHVVENGTLTHGVLSGLSHPQLAKVLKVIHDSPDNNWSLEKLADIAAMSRSKFAAFFKETVGQTPNDYISDVRIALAQDLLKMDKPVNLVANEVGYENGSALARVFRKKLGLSPKQWTLKLKQRLAS